MVVKEYEDAVRIRIKEVVRHRNVDIEQTLSLSVVRNVCVCKRSRNDERKVEVHYRSKVAVDRAEFRILLPPSWETAAHRVPGLTCDVEFRVLVHCSLAPLCSKFSIHIRMCILTDTVNSCVFDPPGRCLDKIVANERVLLVQVRHSGVEPTVCEKLSL